MPSKSPAARARRREREKNSAQRKKDEILQLIKQLPPVECECGCGTLIPALTTSGKPRRFADRHGGRTPKFRAGMPKGLEGPRFDVEPACAGQDPEIFFDDTLTGLARATCGRCPVRQQCLAWAMEHGETEGVWGGLTPRERARRPDFKAPIPVLTSEEKWTAIKYWTAHGETAEHIAERLGISARTVVRWRVRLKEAA